MATAIGTTIANKMGIAQSVRYSFSVDATLSMVGSTTLVIESCILVIVSVITNIEVSNIRTVVSEHMSSDTVTARGCDNKS